MPDFPIVDTHVHLYDPRRLSYPWMKQTPELDRPHLPNHYVRTSAGVDVQGIVFVEVDAAPADQSAEAHFVQEQAKLEPRLKAMVASIPLELGAAAEPHLIDYAKLPLARGVRRLIERHHQEPGWALAEDFVTGVKLLPKFNFTFDLCLFHPQLAEVTELVRRCPEVNFVVDHIAKPGIRAGLRDPGQKTCANWPSSRTSGARYPAWLRRPIAQTGPRVLSLHTSHTPSTASVLGACCSEAIGLSRSLRRATGAGLKWLMRL